MALQRAESVGVKLLQLRGLNYQHVVLGVGEEEWSQSVSGCSRDDLRVVTHCPDGGWQSLSLWQEQPGVNVQRNRPGERGDCGLEGDGPRGPRYSS